MISADKKNHQEVGERGGFGAQFDKEETRRAASTG